MSNRVYVEGTAWKNFVSSLAKDVNIVKQMSDRVVGNIGSAGRKEAVREEEQQFKFGIYQTKYKKGSKDQIYYKVQSRKDSELGGWRSVSGGDRGAKLIGFSFENVTFKPHLEKIAENSRMGINKYVSLAYAYSRMANLWSRDTKPYKSRSGYVGSIGHTFRYGKGQIRQAKTAWWDVGLFNKVVPAAINKADKELQKALDEAGKA